MHVDGGRGGWGGQHPLPDGQIRPPRRPEGVQGDGSPLPDGQIRPPRRPEGVQGDGSPLPDGQIRPPRRPEGVQGDGSPLPDGQIRPPRRPEGVQGDGSPLPDGQIRPPRRPEGVQGDGSPLPDGQIRPPRRPEGVQGDGSPLPDGQIRPPRRPEGARRHGYCDFDSRPFDSHFPDQPQKRLVSAPPTRDGPPPASRELRLARTGLTALLTPAGSSGGFPGVHSVRPRSSRRCARLFPDQPQKRLVSAPPTRDGPPPASRELRLARTGLTAMLTPAGSSGGFPGVHSVRPRSSRRCARLFPDQPQKRLVSAPPTRDGPPPASRELRLARTGLTAMLTPAGSSGGFPGVHSVRPRSSRRCARLFPDQPQKRLVSAPPTRDGPPPASRELRLARTGLTALLTPAGSSGGFPGVHSVRPRSSRRCARLFPDQPQKRLVSAPPTRDGPPPASRELRLARTGLTALLTPAGSSGGFPGVHSVRPRSSRRCARLFPDQPQKRLVSAPPTRDGPPPASRELRLARTGLTALLTPAGSSGGFPGVHSVRPRSSRRCARLFPDQPQKRLVSAPPTRDGPPPASRELRLARTGLTALLTPAGSSGGFPGVHSVRPRSSRRCARLFPDQPQKRLVSAPPTRDGPPPASRELRLARTGLTALLTPAGSWAIV